MTNPLPIAKEKLEKANRWANLLPCQESRYAFAYLAWLRGGAVGFEPERGRITKSKQAEVRANIDAMQLWAAH